MARWLSGLVGALLLSALAWLSWGWWAGRAEPIRVGILHSRTGVMGPSESVMIDAEILALEQINKAGGLLGRRVEWVIADGRSEPSVFATEAERLIRDEKVSVIFGCYTSASRKAVRPVVERSDSLLMYPIAYEGLEDSPNIVYTGAAPNQQVIPAITWCIETLKAKSFFMIGNDYVWPRAVTEITGDVLKAKGATLLGAEFIPFGTTDVDGALTKALASKPDVILLTLVGESNPAIYKRLRAGKEPSTIPAVSFIVAEDDLPSLPVREMTRDYSVCNYFMSIDNPRNAEFLRAYQARYGADRVASDAIATAYNSVRFWAQAVADAESEKPAAARAMLPRQTLEAPEGVISIDRETRHAWRPFFVGKIQPDATIRIVRSYPKPIRPVPYPFSRTHGEWETYLRDLFTGWGNSWSAPTSGTSDRPPPRSG